MDLDTMRKMSRFVLSGLVLSFLGACTTPDGARTGLRSLDETNGIVEFANPPFGDEAKTRILYATANEREEYVLYEQAGHQAEFVYITTRHLHLTNLVINRPFSTVTIGEDFRYNQNASIEEGKAFKISLNGIRFWGKPYRLPERDKTCGLISGKWDQPPDDLRPGKVLFGYFCQPGSTELSEDQIKETVGKIGLRGITVNAIDGGVAVPALDQTASQEALLAEARGQDQETRGNTAFPYKAVRYFKRDDNCRFLPSC